MAFGQGVVNSDRTQRIRRGEESQNRQSEGKVNSRGGRGNFGDSNRVFRREGGRGSWRE